MGVEPAGRVSCRAQRLSASTDRSQRARGCYVLACARCSTPFGINGSVTGVRAVRCPIAVMCSTPFGINGSVTDVQKRSRLNLLECSTPFGINGSVTKRRLARRRVASSAQRLSASTDRSREDQDVVPVAVDRCSTPFGINGSVTRRKPPTSTRWWRCSTPFGINGSVTTGTPKASSARACAQRLSASTDRSPDAPATAIGVNQLCSTPFGINGSVTAARHA